MMELDEIADWIKTVWSDALGMENLADDVDRAAAIAIYFYEVVGIKDIGLILDAVRTAKELYEASVN